MTDIVFNSNRMNAFPTRSGTKPRYWLSPLLFNIVLVVLASTSQEKQIKGILIRKEEIKLSLFTNEIIFYIKNPKESEVLG